MGVHEEPAGVGQVASCPDQARTIGLADRRRCAEGVNDCTVDCPLPVGRKGYVTERRKIDRRSRGMATGKAAGDKEQEEKGPYKCMARPDPERHGIIGHAYITVSTAKMWVRR